MEAQKIDRLGKLDAAEQLSIRQTRKGCFQELLGCEAKTEMKWYDTTGGKEDRIATSLEESGCCIRLLCAGQQPYKMVAKDNVTDEEIFTMDRPFKCAAGSCKCCCYQEMAFSTAGQILGKITEQFWCCVPRFIITDGNDNPVYKLHSPTCCGGMCVDCCAEGNPCCGRGCCKVPFHVFPADQEETDNGAEFAGKIVKVPKGLGAELFTDADAFEVTFPDGASATQKALISGSAILINSMFFEENGNEAA